MTTQTDTQTQQPTTEGINIEGVNTEIAYMYRDASNYKRHLTVVFAGTLTSAQKNDLVNNLDQGSHFIPEQISLPNARDEFSTYYEDDHVWNEILEINGTNAIPTDPRTIHAFYTQVVATEWDPAGAQQHLQQWMSTTPASTDSAPY